MTGREVEMFGIEGLRSDLTKLKEAFVALNEGRYFKFDSHDQEPNSRWYCYTGDQIYPPLKERLAAIESALGITYERECKKVGDWKAVKAKK